MINKIITITILLISISCGLQEERKFPIGLFPPDEPLNGQHQYSVKAYTDKYFQESWRFGKKFNYGIFSVRFNGTVGKDGAYAWVIESGGTYLMEIDPGYWYSATNAEREHTIFHEMAHIYQKRGHTSNKTNIYGLEIPVSVMYPESFDPQIYSANKENYLNELFTGNHNYIYKYPYFGNFFDNSYYIQYGSINGRSIASVSSEDIEISYPKKAKRIKCNFNH